jgi:hypothetical protein
MDNYNKEVKRILRAELVRRDISYDSLVKMLNDEGVKETKSSISSKISRGAFSASFLIQCLKVIGCKCLTIEEINFEKA